MQVWAALWPKLRCNPLRSGASALRSTARRRSCGDHGAQRVRRQLSLIITAQIFQSVTFRDRRVFVKKVFEAIAEWKKRWQSISSGPTFQPVFIGSGSRLNQATFSSGTSTGIARSRCNSARPAILLTWGYFRFRTVFFWDSLICLFFKYNWDTTKKCLCAVRESVFLCIVRPKQFGGFLEFSLSKTFSTNLDSWPFVT